ncbi:UDP-N-acetylmuramate--L-alanine ligase [Helicobacter enhydrae]|uniref:UDP-N-acetylmuramate--L-alanine ligase n=1 Tax=Helicobacter enhydrae TaxID=222136 RepID=A0A1B1U6U9_9HELI|nr:UDP-N-acetylmuramate--L-alanine ligase [Helicobacter enhydrae]ANV98489.1 UDP-N-acetylmuramate--L-alanine ligase [Helicobacter enhydrae]
MFQKIHFVGIGGIGISGLAKYLHSQGVQITGSDIAHNKLTHKLLQSDIPISIPHSAHSITDQDLVIHSAIIKPSNIELQEAQQKGIPILSRKEALKEILKDKRVFSICGAHGKSTTTAMLSSILPHFGAIIGAESKEFDCNVRAIPSDSIVFEADESDQSFLNSNPYCAIVTNTEPEHMESYDYNLEAFYDAYLQFLTKATKRVINMEDPFLATLDLEAIRLYPQEDIKEIEFFLKDDEPFTRFRLKDLGIFEVWGFGYHTALNASMAILAAKEEISLSQIRTNLTHFKGIKKRFDIVYKDTQTIIIDDYAHHPTEIKSTLQAIGTYTQIKNISPIICIWQPHKYSRFLDNQQEFIQCFCACDKLVILPVWRAGEEHQEIDFASLFASYNPILAHSITQKQGVVYLHDEHGEIFQQFDSGLIVGFGAGDITYQIRDNNA